MEQVNTLKSNKSASLRGGPPWLREDRHVIKAHPKQALHAQGRSFLKTMKHYWCSPAKHKSYF